MDADLRKGVMKFFFVKDVSLEDDSEDVAPLPGG